MYRKAREENTFTTVEEPAECRKFHMINVRNNPEREITKPFCCDLFSVTTGRTPEGGVWVTVMDNMNTLVVASLADVAYVTMAGGTVLSEVTVGKVKQQEITVLATEKPIFEAALAIHEMIHD